MSFSCTCPSCMPMMSDGMQDAVKTDIIEIYYRTFEILLHVTLFEVIGHLLASRTTYDGNGLWHSGRGVMIHMRIVSVYLDDELVLLVLVLFLKDMLSYRKF